MTISCEHCNSINSTDNLFCYSCETLLFSPQVTISKLLEAQEKMEQTHLSQLTILKSKIKRVEDYILNHAHKSSLEPKLLKEDNLQEKSVEPFVQEYSMKTISEIIEKPEPVVLKEIVTDRTDEKKDVLPSKSNIHSKPIQTEVKSTTGIKQVVVEERNTKTPNTPIHREPTEFQKQISQFFEPMFDGVDLVKQAFTRYKQEGKLPIVLMMIAGILAILVGFGYLMQRSFDQMGIYSGLVKVSFGFVFSFAIGFIGKRLYKKDVKYEEYSSALLSLMVILNYLLIYYVSNLSGFPVLSSGKIGFLLIVANTTLSILIAFKYETKIIAVLSLIGGALTPFYLNESGNPDFYFGYLWILLVAANFIAIRIKWFQLNYISFVLFLILVEGAVFTDASESTLFIGYIHLFAYLFFYITLFDKRQLKSTLTKNDLLILSGNLTVLLINIYNTVPDFFWIGTLYLVNGLIFMAFLAMRWKGISKSIKIGLFVTVGSFIGLAIPFLFGQALMGLFWSIEAILLIVLGFNFAMKSIRSEGYIVLSIALFKLFYSAILIVEQWGESIIHEGFLNYMVLGIIFSSLWFIGNKFEAQFTRFEKSLYGLFKEIIPIWLSSIVFIVSYDLFGYYGFNVMIIPMLGLIIWHYKFNTKEVESIGLFHLLFFIAAFIISTKQVNSYSFSDQLLYGKIGMLELVVLLWSLKLFYQKMGYMEKVKHQTIQIFRIVFFVLLPLIFIKQIFKHAQPYFPEAIWLGFLMSYGLHRKLKFPALLTEAHLLFLAAVGVNVAIYDVSGLILGIVVMIAIIIIEKGYLKSYFDTSNFRYFIVLMPYICIGFIGYIAIREDYDFKYSIYLIGLLLAAMAYFRDKLDLIYVTYRIAIRLSLLATFLCGSLFLADRPEFVQLLSMIALISFLGYILFLSKTDYIDKSKKTSLGINIVILQILVVLTYSLSILAMNFDLDGPLMTIFLLLHAICLLFFGLKTNRKSLNKGALLLFIITLIKVVFHDIRDFTGTSKIIVLIVIGVILLSASYGYIRIKNKYLPKDIDLSNNSNDEED